MELQKYLNNIGVNTTPMNKNFLYSNMVTNEMIEWYYSKPSTISVYMMDIDDSCSVVEITELVNDSIVSKSFTIGKADKRDIYNRFMYYHSMEMHE